VLLLVLLLVLARLLMLVLVLLLLLVHLLALVRFPLILLSILMGSLSKRFIRADSRPSIRPQASGARV